jgi:hypothetical protein
VFEAKTTAASWYVSKITNRHSRAVSSYRPSGRSVLDWRGVLAFIVLALLFALPISYMLHTSAASMEESSLLEYPVLALHGKLPTINYQSVYGPANAWVPAAAMWLFGVSVNVERGVGLLYRALLLVSLYAVIRPRWGRAAGVVSASLCWFMMVSFAPLAYSWLGGTAFALAGLACSLNAHTTARWRTHLFVAGGFLTAIGLLFRPDLIVAVLLSFLVFFLGPGRKYLRTWIFGFGVGLVPGLVFVAAAGPVNVFRGLVRDPLEMAKGRSLPIPPNPSRVSDYFGRLDVALTVGKRWPGPAPAAQIFWLFWVTIVSLALAVAGGIRARLSSPRRCRLLVISAFAVGLAPEMLQRLDVTHVLLVGSIWVALVPVAGFELLSGSRLPKRPLVFVAVGLAAAVLVGCIGSFYVSQADYGELPLPGHVLATASVTNDGRTLPVGSEVLAAQLRALLAVVDHETRPGQRLFVGPSDLRFTNYNETYLYWLLPKLTPATYYLEMNPGLANRPGSRLASDVATARWLILSRRYAMWSEPNGSVVAGSDAANKVVAKDFCVTNRQGPYEVLERCHRALSFK